MIPLGFQRHQEKDRVALEEVGAISIDGPNGWVCGKAVEPPVAGTYQRRHAFGVSYDYWDGAFWRRSARAHKITGSDVSRPDGGVVCANQDLDWRAIP